jgi:hypothetical protein
MIEPQSQSFNLAAILEKQIAGSITRQFSRAPCTALKWLNSLDYKAREFSDEQKSRRRLH